MTTSEPYIGECKDCYQHVLSPECDGHGIRAGEPCPHGKPMEKQTTSEPTTGTMVGYLRMFAGYGDHVNILNKADWLLLSADRLESQEQLIERLLECDNGIDFGSKYYEGYDCGYQAGWQVGCDNAEMKQMIETLTARAESAEQERDDIEKSLARRIMKHLSDNEFDSTYVCEICEYNLTNSPKCLSCGSDHHYGENFELKHTLRG